MSNFEKEKPRFFSILGDSISTLEGYTVPCDSAYYEGAKKLDTGIIFPRDTWWGKVIDALGGELLVNNSISGSMVTKHPAAEYPSYGFSPTRLSSLAKDGTSPDVIIVYMGTNDFGYAVPVYPSDGSGDNDTSVFSVAYSLMLRGLKDMYPNSSVWCLTLPVSRCSAKENFSFPYRYGKRHIEEYSSVIRDLSGKFGCRLIDIYDEKNCHDTLDGFHPNLVGMDELAKKVLSALRCNT